MSHCGTPSFDNHLNHCFVVLKHIQQSFLMRKLDVGGKTISIIQNVDHSLRSLVWPVIFITVHNGLHRSIVGLNHVSKDWNNQISQIESGNPVQSQSSVQRDDFGFCWTVWNWCLLLTHPTYWNKCMTSKNEQCSTRSRCWVLKISRKNRSLETVPACIV